MRIKKIHIQNYKSLVDFELDSPPPFCAFVGPNASGKSNIFEALEFTNCIPVFGTLIPTFFNGRNSIVSYSQKNINPVNSYDSIFFFYEFADKIKLPILCTFTSKENKLPRFDNFISIDNYNLSDSQDKSFFNIQAINDQNSRQGSIKNWEDNGNVYDKDFELFFDNFSRIFVGNPKLIRTNQQSSKLQPDASNLSQIIGQIFQDERKREDFIEWVQILIPEFQNIQVKKSNIDGSFEFFVYEKSSDKPFPKHLISDGTYNILALMAAVYQSSEPQFLCIEEPENGLHPHAIKLLVEFFREKCEDEGHHIWLNTHSPTLVRGMAIDEIVLVNKINGQTRAKRVTNMGDININTDEAWLTNALGGGTLWSR